MSRLAFACLCLFALVGPARAASLVPNDFAAGFALPEAGDAGIHVVELPAAVYEKAMNPDLTDVRVFNGAGEAVPQVVRMVAEKNEEHWRPLPFFPLPGEPMKQPTDLSVQVALGSDGKVLSVNTNAKNPTSPTTSYLLDATQFHDARPSALELHWRSPATGLLPLSLMHSDDLTHWLPLVDRVVLADLSYQGGQVIARRIPLASRPLSYIRLDCADCREPLLLDEVSALTGGQPVTDDRWRWTRLRPGRITEDKGQRFIFYQLGTKMAVTAAQLRFPAVNSLLRAAIEARSALGEWRQVARADFYRLDMEGLSLANPPVGCSPVAAAEWRLRVITDQVGLANAATFPELELGWERRELLFLGRGPGPYILAFGSAKAAAEASSGQDDLMLAALRDIGAEAHVHRIKAGAPLVLGGDQALRPLLVADQGAAIPWQKIMLWLILIAGVVILAVMAKTLLRELRAKTD